MRLTLPWDRAEDGESNELDAYPNDANNSATSLGQSGHTAETSRYYSDRDQRRRRRQS